MKVLRSELRRQPAVPCAPRSLTSPAHVTTLVLAIAFDVLVVLGAIVVGLPLPWVLGIAAVTVLTVACATQRSLRSALAGLTLLVVRPYSPGESLRLFSPRLGRPVEVELVRVGLVNTLLADRDGLVVVPNSLLLRHPPECADRAR